MKNITSFILAGGEGARVAGLYPDLPKALVPVVGEPFLYWLVTWLVREGLQDFVFSLGHRGDLIENWLNTAPVMSSLRWQVCREAKPLGTGGGARTGLHLCSDKMLIVNGDSLLLTSLRPAVELFEDKSPDGVLFGIPTEDASRYGSLAIDNKGFLVAFREKQPGAGLINAGIYLLRKAALEIFPEGQKLSMEYDVIPRLLASGRKIAVYKTPSGTPFIDIGTPASLAEADDFVRRHIARAV